MPRKTKLTPALQKRFIDALKVGATHRICCEYAGISQETLYTWLDKGAEGRQPYLAFFEQVKKASGQAAVGWLSRIEKAAKEGSWQAAAWKLERRYTEEYGRTITEHAGVVKVDIQAKQQEEQQVVDDFTQRLAQIRARTLSVITTQDILPDGPIPA